MPHEIGTVEAIFRYPVKSMRGQQFDTAALGWHGLEGDRRLALRRMDNPSDLPWLTASRLAELLLYSPQPRQDAANSLPSDICTPDGKVLPIFGADLAKEIACRYGAPVEMMRLRHGVFDDATVSVIAHDTVQEIGRLSGQPPDVRRFRPNILVRPTEATPFQEDRWIGGALIFGEADDAPVVSLTMPDIRCAMVNLHPDTAHSTPDVLKAVVRANDNQAGVYGTVTRIGRLAVGQRVFLQP